MGHSLFFGSSRKVGEANKGLGEAPKAARGRSMKARPTQSRKGVKGGLRPFSSAPCRVKGQRPLWGLGQRPNCSASDQFQGSRQQRCRQRSVPASNFARPQTRPQAALPPRVREEPKKAGKSPAFFNESSFFPPFPGCSAGFPAGKRCPWRRFSSCRRIG